MAYGKTNEFGAPVALGTGVSDMQRTSIYYCDPMRSGQKGELELKLPGKV